MSRANAQARQRAREKQKARGGGVVRRGQRATLNGKPVVADGKGNWVSVKRTDGTKEIGYTLSNPNRKNVGSYEVGKNRTGSSSSCASSSSSSSSSTGSKYREGQKRISNGKNQTYKGGKWVTTSKAGDGARRQQAAATKIEKERKAKSGSKPTPTPTPTPKPTSTKSSTKSTVKSPTRTKASGRLSATLSGKRGLAASARQPKNAGAGNGAPGAANAAKPNPKKYGVKAGNNKKGNTQRLRDALKSVKKYVPKKKK